MKMFLEEAGYTNISVYVSKDNMAVIADAEKP